MNLTSDDVEFFSHENNWSGGPMYEICLYFSSNEITENLESVIFEAGNLSIWDGVAIPRLVKTIFQFDGLVPVGLVHHHNLKSASSKPFATYSLSIYPPHYRRALGGAIHGRGLLLETERWKDLDREKVRLFHRALFSMIDEIAKAIPLIGVNISTEDKGLKVPYSSDGSICISPNLASVLGLEASAIPNSSGYFVSVGAAAKLLGG